MDDRELLELAANAAGIETRYWDNGDGPYTGGAGFVLPINHLWNPLTDDGDALRLASSLELDVMYRVVGGARVEVLPCGGPLVVEHYHGDRLAASRRAIVRAAAEVGRKTR